MTEFVIATCATCQRLISRAVARRALRRPAQFSAVQSFWKTRIPSHFALLLLSLLSLSSGCLFVCGFAHTAAEGGFGQSLDPSRTYKYSYEAGVELNEANLAQDMKIHKKSADVGVRISFLVELFALWTNSESKYDQVIEMKFVGVKIFNASGMERGDATAYATKNFASLRTITKPAVFRWTDGLVKEFYASTDETIASLNIKRGVLGFFQIRTHEGTRAEEDLSGRCNVMYKIEGTDVRKVKDLKSCVNNEEGFTTINKVLGVSTSMSCEGIYTLAPDKTHIVRGVNLETHLLRVNIKREISLHSLGRQKLDLLSVEETLPSTSQSKDEALQAFNEERVAAGEKYVKQSLLSERDVENSAEGHLDVIQTIRDLAEELSKENMANVSSAQSYISAVRAARRADKRTLQRLLKIKKFKDILHTMVDILAAAQTEASQEAILGFVDFKTKDGIDLAERALTGIAFSSHPSERVLSDLLELFNGQLASKEIKETVGLAMGAVLQKYCAIAPGNCDREIPADVIDMVGRGLAESRTEKTQNLYILIARNAGLPTFMGRLVHLAENSDFHLVCHRALESLAVFETKEFDDQSRDALSRIYHQNRKRYDNTVRAAAASRLLMNAPRRMDIVNIVLSLPEEKSKEFANFVYLRILDLIKTNHPSKEILQDVLADHSVWNYWTMANSGMASAFTGYLFSTEDAQVTYGLFMEYSNAGMMRRTASDFTLHGHGGSVTLTEAGIVVQGLESLTGSAPDEGEKEYDSMVGMASAMVGVKLRPLTFFRGYGDMMSLIWAGSSGEPSGVEAMLMLIDHLQLIPLASGLRVKAEVLGAVSTKISADIDFSLWSRTVEIVTTTGGALSVQCRLSLESPLARASVRHSADAQSSIDLSVYTDFSSLPPMSCIRISYPDFSFKKSLRKFEKVESAGNGKFLTLSKRSSKTYGRTLPLQMGNSRTCTKIMGF